MFLPVSSFLADKIGYLSPLNQYENQNIMPVTGYGWSWNPIWALPHTQSYFNVCQEVLLWNKYAFKQKFSNFIRNWCGLIVFVSKFCHFLPYFQLKIHKVSLCGNILSLQVVLAVCFDGNMPNECFEGIFIFKEDAFSHLNIMRLIESRSANKIIRPHIFQITMVSKSIIFLPDWQNLTFILILFVGNILFYAYKVQILRFEKFDFASRRRILLKIMSEMVQMGNIAQLSAYNLVSYDVLWINKEDSPWNLSFWRKNQLSDVFSQNCTARLVGEESHTDPILHLAISKHI